MRRGHREKYAGDAVKHLAAQFQRQVGVIKTGRFLTGGDVGNFLTLNANRFIKGRAVMLIANFIKRRGLIRLQADAKKGV